jgi:hypothetical protein
MDGYQEELNQINRCVLLHRKKGVFVVNDGSGNEVDTI